jgi:TRAP-type mannitol/chloroaromatic compound transport system substrate-binding protein
LPERPTLPAAIPQAELTRLASEAAAATWRLTLFSTSTVTGFSEQPNNFITELSRLSNNRLTVSALSAAGDPRTIDFTRNIRAQTNTFAWHSPLQSISRNRTYGLFAGTVPFGLAPADHVRWLRAEGAHLLEQLYRRDGFDIRVIPCGVGGSVGAWFRREVRNPGDIRGLKVRGMIFTTEVMERLGATGASINTNNLVEAFRDNRVDAVLAATPQTSLFLRDPLPAPVYHYPSFQSPSFLLELMVPAQTWVQMSEPQRRLVDEACRRNLDQWATNFTASQNQILNQVRARRVSVRPFPQPVQDAIRRAATEVLNEEAAKNDGFRQVLESYNRFRRP